jgi:hypothetical protein
MNVNTKILKDMAIHAEIKRLDTCQSVIEGGT